MNKIYQAMSSERPVEIGVVDTIEKKAQGPAISTDGIGSPVSALQMLTPGIYAIPPIGSKVEFIHTEEGPKAGQMVDWPEEQELMQMLAKKATKHLPNYNPGDLVIFAAGSLLRDGYVQYLHFKTDGSVSWVNHNPEELDPTKRVITELTSDQTGLKIKTKKFEVIAEQIVQTETGGA